MRKEKRIITVGECLKIRFTNKFLIPAGIMVIVIDSNHHGKYSTVKWVQKGVVKHLDVPDGELVSMTIQHADGRKKNRAFDKIESTADPLKKAVRDLEVSGGRADGNKPPRMNFKRKP